jgi:hypothetical protein
MFTYILQFQTIFKSPNTSEYFLHVEIPTKNDTTDTVYLKVKSTDVWVLALALVPRRSYVLHFDIDNDKFLNNITYEEFKK